MSSCVVPVSLSIDHRWLIWFKQNWNTIRTHCYSDYMYHTNWSSPNKHDVIIFVCTGSLTLKLQESCHLHYMAHCSISIGCTQHNTNHIQLHHIRNIWIVLLRCLWNLIVCRYHYHCVSIIDCWHNGKQNWNAIYTHCYSDCISGTDWRSTARNMIMLSRLQVVIHIKATEVLSVTLRDSLFN